jgi:hypothetical protein
MAVVGGTVVRDDRLAKVPVPKSLTRREKDREEIAHRCIFVDGRFGRL